MDPIKEAMIREEDTGERNPALDPYREWKPVEDTTDELIEKIDEAMANPAPIYAVGAYVWQHWPTIRASLKRDIAAPEALRQRICLAYQGDTVPCTTPCVSCYRIAKALAR